MKLTESTLRDMVREILKEDEMPFPPPPDEESVESAEDSLDHDQVVVRFYENDEKEIEEGCAEDKEMIVGEKSMEESTSLDDIVAEEINKYIKKKT